jgi:hypothetical protein
MNNKVKDIEILEHRISELELKINNFEKNNISEKKLENLRILKLQFEDKLSELQYA